MKIHDFIRNSAHLFKPKTPHAALLAAQEGVLPVESYIYKSSSVKPLYEEPFDLEEIQRILSRRDNDLDTNLLLMEILTKLSYNRDPETALFAAESMNAIENRYNREIEDLVKRIEADPRPGYIRECSKKLYELALLNNQEVIRRFYLKEAFMSARRLEDTEDYRKEDGLFVISIFNELGLYGQSKQTLNSLKERFGSRDTDLLRMEAVIEFAQHNFMNVILVYLKLGGIRGRLDTEELEALSFWTET